MSRFALIDTDGQVVNVIELEPGGEWTPPDGIAMVASDVAGPGDRYDGRDFVPPPPPPIDLIACAAAARWARETGGITLPNGARIATDAVAQGKIDAANNAFANGTLQGSISFKGIDGWFELDAAGMKTVYGAVVAHVQACYAEEKKVVEAVRAGAIKSAAEISAAFAAL